MDDVTLIALKQSIEKWERRAVGEHNLPLGTASCPLCRLFHGNYRADGLKNSCEGCPVFEKTGEKYCIDTPYRAYGVNRTDLHAKQELEFLRSLLPAEEEEKKKENFSWVNLDYL